MIDDRPPARPDPDELLRELGGAREGDGAPARAGDAPRGRLKIFFGMCPGVGRTYAMLEAAQRLAAQGVDVAVGVVETHGRAETEQMLLGLDILPRLRIEYQGASLHEFDTDAAVRRRPDVLLIDELAHTNAPGTPTGREKRWQDVEACLAAGLHVLTTLNVQHLESLNDVIAQITGVRVRETIPDRVFDEADEIELVDLPVEALHERLRGGKVYLGEHAQRAVDPADGFFRAGNLTALRELALRRTASWVDAQMRRYKQSRGIRALWPAGERVIVAVSPSPASARLIRAAKRMAAGLHAELIAVHVETTRTAALSARDRERLRENLRLAESLGATTQTLAGDDPARELIAFARARNVGKVVVGKSARPRWKDRLFGSFVDGLIRASGDIDVFVVRGDDPDVPALGREHPAAGDASEHAPGLRLLSKAGASALVIGGCTLLALAVERPPDLSEESLLLLGGVVLSALWVGRTGAVAASVLAVLSFNYFFTEPRFTLNVNDPGYLLTFAVMLAVGLVVGTLAARAREQTVRAWSRERSTAAQHALARELAAARDAHEVATILARHAHDLLGAEVVVARGARAGVAARTLEVLASAGAPDWFQGAGADAERERGVALWALEHGRAAGRGTATLPASQGLYAPLVGSAGRVGVVGLRPARGPFLARDLETLDALVAQASSALERVALSESQQAARFEAERERLRSALLSSVSHDLRTPLASITGAASTLRQPSQLDESTRQALLRTISEESARLNDLIANLVFATRLESGAVAPRREWTTVEEIVGVGLARHRESLSARPFRVSIAPGLPMIRVDNAMLPQVVHNLVENALRYAAPGATPPVQMGLTSWATESAVVVRVWDEGPGLAEDESSKVFERFYRGRASKPGPAEASGLGLGLTICEGIVRAHGGRIWAEPNTPRGVAFLFSLPIERPQPTMPTEPAEQGAP